MNSKIPLILIKRIISSLVVLLISISFIFILLRISPGDPSTKFIGPGLNHQLAERVKESFSLNSPVHEQYFTFIKNFLMLDMGVSYIFKMPVLNVIFQYLPFTLLFSIICFSLQMSGSIFLLILTCKNRNGFFDKMISKLSLAMYSVPVFLIGVGLLYLFSFMLDVFPSSGLMSIREFNSLFDELFDILKHLFLPVLTLSIPGTVLLYTYIRENAEDIYNKSFITYLRSMGISEGELLRKHVIPNAISPMISIAGIELGMLFSGAIITEIIFGLPGLGRLAMDAILGRDYPLIIGCSFISGILMIIANLLADYAKFRTDKRHIKEITS